MEEGMQLIDENGKFNSEGLKDFMKTIGFAQCGLSCAIVAIIGSQSSGKSTLLNHTFHTKFKEMDAYKGRGQTTKGIWIAKCGDIEPFTLAMDFEGTDSNERGEDDTAFEKQSTLFALAIADIVLINMWYKDIGLEHAASRPLLKTVFQVMKRLFEPRKKTLLFVIRDHTKTPLEYLKTALSKDIEKIWAAVSEPETNRSAPLSDFFNVDIVALSSYEFEEDKFKEQVAQLRQRFFHPISLGGLAGDRRELEPAVGFPTHAEMLWNTIKDNKDLDLPALKVMVAAVRCEEIAEEKLKLFTSDEDWLALEKAVQAGPAPGFGVAVSSILETYLSEYDMEVAYYDKDVRNAKRQQLKSKALVVLHDACDTLLSRLTSNTLKSFRNRLQQGVNEGQQFVASCRLCSQSCMLVFDQGCEDVAIRQSDRNASKFRKELIDDMLSEIMEKYEKQLTDVLTENVRSLLKAGEQDSWESIRDLLECNAEAAISEFSDAAVNFDLPNLTLDAKFHHLREHARAVVKKNARYMAHAERVLQLMKDRFKESFTHEQNSKSWYKSVFGLKEIIDEMERKALSASLKILSTMAAIRLDNEPDQIEYVLFSSLMDKTVLPSSQYTGTEVTLNLLALRTWEEVSPNVTTLLKPEDCMSLWMKLKEEGDEPTLNQTRSEARKRIVFTGLAGAALVGAAAITMGPATVATAGMTFLMRKMWL